MFNNDLNMPTLPTSESIRLTGELINSEKELEKHFDIKIIRFEFSKPIKNKFK